MTSPQEIIPDEIGKLVVTQEDREAAADFTRERGLRTTRERVAMREGHLDHDPFVQAFARHRQQTTNALLSLQAERDALREANARLRHALYPFGAPPLYVFDRDTFWVPTPRPDGWIGGGLFSTEDFRTARAALSRSGEG